VKLYAHHDESGAVRALIVVEGGQGLMMPALPKGHKFSEVKGADLSAVAQHPERLAEMLRAGLKVRGAREPYELQKS